MPNQLSSATPRPQLWAGLWLSARYQALTKPLLFLLAFPLFGYLAERLIASAGRTVLSSGDGLSALLNWQGVLLLLLGTALVVLTIATDIAAFIIMEGVRVQRGSYPSVRQTLFAALRSMRRFLHPATWLLVAYVGLVVPLGGIGLSAGPLRDFKIPNFITDVIYQSPLYLGLYSAALLLLALLGFCLIFTFHFVLLAGHTPWRAMLSSAAFVRRHPWPALKTLLGALAPIAAALLLVFAITVLLQTLPALATSVAARRFWALFTLMLGAQLLALVLLLAGPYVLRRLTLFFLARHTQLPGVPVLPHDAKAPAPARVPRLLWLGAAATLAFNAAASAVATRFFDNLFIATHPIAIIAHRGGGNLGAENTLAGLEAAIAAGAAWSEIDVQRTADGAYILNHDGDFQRLSGSRKTASQITLAQARALPVKDLFDPTRGDARIATLEETLDAAKDRIGLFIELKGKTADKQMVDDVARLIKAKGMEKQAVILSLDYALIQYSEQRYPELDTGFLYFFSLGNPATLTGDYLVMEEGEATQRNIASIRAAGKRVVVWTVNTKESIARFTATDVDGIITDYPLEVKAALAARKDLSDWQLILEKLLD